MLSWKEERSYLLGTCVCIQKITTKKYFNKKKNYSCYQIMSILQLIANADCKRGTTVHSRLVYTEE